MPASSPSPRQTRLSEVRKGQTGLLDHVDPGLGENEEVRLAELGFVPGVQVEAVAKAPLAGPRVYRVDGALIALRDETARHVILTSVDSAS